MKSIWHDNPVIADSGYWVAQEYVNDRFHQRAKDVMAQLTDIPVTTWPVIAEISFRLKGSGGTDLNPHLCATSIPNRWKNPKPFQNFLLPGD